MSLADGAVPTSPKCGSLWAVLLAGGDGTRLRGLTERIVGDDRPKQFCPIVGAESLLRQTRTRLDPLFARDRQAFVVSRAHERYYSKELADVEESLIVAQPMNRGTAVGIIAALVRIMRADPDAVVGFFPCDHHYSDDESFRRVIREAASSARQFTRSVVIVGAEADCAETEYGWIDEAGLAVSQTQAGPLCGVNRFWEKPALPVAKALLQSGCLWNTFVTIGSAVTFLELICSQVPDVVRSVTCAMAEIKETTYARLPTVDFSRDILVHQARRLLVLRDSGSGWADLGSPDRVVGLLARQISQPAWFHRTTATGRSEFELSGNLMRCIA